MSPANVSSSASRSLATDYRRQLESVCNNATLALFIMDDRQYCIYMNPAAELLTGFTLAEVQGAALHDLIHHTRPDGTHYPMSECPIDRAFPEQNQQKGEDVFVHKDGSFYPVAYTASPIREGERAIGTIIEVRGIAAEREAAERLRKLQRAIAESEERLRLATAAGGLGVFEWDVRTDTSVWENDRMFEIYGLPPAGEAPTKEKYLRDIVLPDDTGILEQALAEGMRSGRRLAVQYRVRRSDGAVRWVELAGRFQYDENGTARRLVGTVADITESKLAQDELFEGRERLKLAVEGAGMATWDVDLRTGTAIWSDNYFAMLGLDARSAQASIDTWRARVHPDDRKSVLAALERARLDRTQYNEAHRVIRDSDGQVAWLEPFGRFVYDDEGNAVRFMGVLFDVTARKQAEEALRESEQRFRTLAETIPEVVWTADPDGNVDYYNHRWFEFTGQSAEEARLWGWSKLVHPEDLPHCASRWERSVRTGEEYEIEARIRGIDGEWRWIIGRALPLRNRDGAIVKWFGINTDIHDQKQAEAALRRSNEDLQQFAYAASHDLQEPLRMVTAYTQLLARRYSGQLDETGQYYIDTAVGGARRLEALLRDLRTYWQVSERGPLTTERVHLSEVLQEALEHVGHAFEQAGATIEAAPLPAVKAQRVPLVQVFHNLLSNAIKYRSPERPLEIRVSARRTQSDWIVEFADNGIGIEPRYLSQIFGVFKRLHGSEYPGTGMGLAISQTIIERFGGRIWAESDPARGTTILFSLPLDSE